MNLGLQKIGGALRAPGATALVASVLSAGAAAALSDEELLQRAFEPYSVAIPTFPGYEPGLSIDAGNVERFTDALPEGLGRIVGEGGYTLETRPTLSVEISKNYREATRRELGKVTLGEKVGEIYGHVAGRPFVEDPSKDDPRAGEKLMWNYQYGYAAGDSLSIDPMHWTYIQLDTGEVDRRLELEAHLLNIMGRVDQEPKPELSPNRDKILRSGYLIVREPFELRDTQLLIHRYIDDMKRDDAWMYNGFSRRVRRLATGQTTDAYLGSDLMIEDFGGYNGRISDYRWEYVGTENLFMPFYKHSELESFAEDPPPQKDGYQFVAFGGQGGCFPLIHWQLRRVHVVDGFPNDEAHPLSRRRIYLDAQTFTIPYEDIYDSAGKLWKVYLVGQAHPDFYKGKDHQGAGVSFFEAFTAVDLQARRCTIGQFYLHPNSKRADRKVFSPSYMESQGH